MAAMRSLSFASGTPLRLFRVAALLMLGLLALDLMDAWCDPLVPARESTVTTPSDSGTDPCSEICVDDCFCCSSSVPAGRPALISAPAPTTLVTTLGSPCTSPGFALPPDHVPLATN